MSKNDPHYRWAALAIYNAERGRGLVHTPEWVEFMAREQAEFDAEEAIRHPEVKEIVKNMKIT